jgi:hypothetical protein
MTGSVVNLESQRRKREQTAAVKPTSCSCHGEYICYPHRIAEAARILRVDLAAARSEGRVSVTRFTGTVEAVLPILDAILAECLPTEAGAR